MPKYHIYLSFIKVEEEGVVKYIKFKAGRNTIKYKGKCFSF